jgi:hypothetical protein
MVSHFSGSVVSHPVARKKAKGWGTELVQDRAVKGLGVDMEWLRARSARSGHKKA